MKMMSNQIQHSYRMLEQVKAACAGLTQINLVGKVSAVDGDTATMPTKTIQRL